MWSENDITAMAIGRDYIYSPRVRVYNVKACFLGTSMVKMAFSGAKSFIRRNIGVLKPKKPGEHKRRRVEKYYEMPKPGLAIFSPQFLKSIGAHLFLSSHLEMWWNLIQS